MFRHRRFAMRPGAIGARAPRRTGSGGRRTGRAGRDRGELCVGCTKTPPPAHRRCWHRRLAGSSMTHPGRTTLMHASHRPSTSYASPLRLVCLRIPRCPSPGPPPSLLPPLLPPARVRAPPWLRTWPNGASAARAGARRRLVRNRLRAWGLDRPVRKDSRTSHQRATGRPPPRDVVRPSRTADHRSALHVTASPSLQDVHDPRRRQPASLWNQRLERAGPSTFAARRHRRETDPAERCPQLDSPELSVVVDGGSPISRTNTCSR